MGVRDDGYPDDLNQLHLRSGPCCAKGIVLSFQRLAYSHITATQCGDTLLRLLIALLASPNVRVTRGAS